MSFTGIILILLVALIVFGPEDLPKIARQIGKIIYQARRYYDGFMKDFRNVIDEPMKDLTKDITETLDTPRKELEGIEASILKAVSDKSQSSEKSSASSDSQSQDGQTENSDSGEILLRYEDDVSQTTESSQDKVRAANPLEDLPQTLVQGSRQDNGTD